MDVDPALARLIEELETTEQAAEVLDPEWRLAWVSPQLKVLLGEDDDEALGIGLNWVESRGLAAWTSAAPPEMGTRWLRRLGPYMAHDLPGGIDGVISRADPESRKVLREIEPAEPPPIAAHLFEYHQPGLPPTPIGALSARVRDEGGRLIATAIVYGSPLPASVLSLIMRGDPAMFARMAEMYEPRRRSAAVLFADLEASGLLSRRLSTSAYFRLIRAVTSGFDRAVASHGGIVGKHAGDGVTAFFLSEQVGSDSAAARAALEAARASVAAARDAADSLRDADVPIEPDELRLNVGVHWGGSLYMGQVVTDGRLEVTALGDEVNEAARLEQTAKDGAMLVSKPLLERLSAADAGALGLDVDAMAYRPLSQLDGASEKARRDAGTIAVADLREQLVEAAAAGPG